MKLVLRSRLAHADIESALDHLAAAPHVAGDFLDALEKAVTHIQRGPGTGSPRHAHELDIPGLRFWLLRKFPYAVFYLERDDHLLMLRLVHMSRDIPASFQG